jgi:hypothetical protein
LNTWYTLVQRAWKENGRLCVATFLHDGSTGHWLHTATLSTLYPNKYLTAYNDAFLENWNSTDTLQNGRYVRKAWFKDCWNLTTAGAWEKSSSRYCSVNGDGDVRRNGIYHNSFNSFYDSTEDAYCMQHGGNTTPSAAFNGGRLLYLPAQANQGNAPVLSTAVVTSVTATDAAEGLTINWAVDDSNAPQLSARVELLDAAGRTIQTVEDTLPQRRSALLSTPLYSGEYTVRVTVRDIFNQLSRPATVVYFPPAPVGSTYAFYRAINLGGPALTLDGNAWAGSTAPNYSTNGTAFQNQSVPLVPATDAARAGMIRAAVYRVGSLRATLSSVPAGTYQLYAYVWEDNSPEVYRLSVNGQVLRANYNSGPAGTWARLGPYTVTLAAPGSIQLTSSGGTANFSGIELWKQRNQAPVLAAIGNQIVTIGQTLTFTAVATDPDAGQTLSYTLIGAPVGAVINLTTGAFAWTPTAAQVGARTFRVRVTDNGSPARMAEETITLMVSPVPAGSFVFYRAINLGGPALTLDGNAWAGSTAPNYSTNGTAFQNQSVPLVPATDAVRAGMIRAAIYGPNLSLRLSSVPAGTYQAYLYVWEDNSSEVYSLFLNGQPVRANYNSGPVGTWAKLGPYPVTLTATGSVQFSSTGGWSNFSGVELWQQIGAPPVARLASASQPHAKALGVFRVQAYPNPSATGRFTLVLPEGMQGAVTYSLVSALGQQVGTGRLPAATPGTAVELDLARQMGSGSIYYLLLRSTQGQAHLRLVRE